MPFMVEIPCKGGDGEKSYFAGGSDKKCSKSIYMGHWNRGSVLQKMILDVYAHLRGEGPKASTFSKIQDLLLRYTHYAAASLVVTNGNKHLDFEFFPYCFRNSADFSVPGKTGPDGGRTEFLS
jgi:hypothetical protein